MDQKQKTILIVFGTRPEALKLIPLIESLRDEPSIKTIICNTGQHKELLEEVLNDFNIKPDYNLSLMKPGQSLSALTSKLLTACDEVIANCKPDLVIVHGDTSTTFAASLAAFHSGVKIGHVEAGLRTNNLKSPWPEEANRRLTAVITDLHFVPTVTAKENLIKEGVDQSKIHLTGNTIIDMLKKQLKIMKKITTLHADVTAKIGFDPIREKYVLITGHRRENFGDGFKQICEAIRDLAGRYPKRYFVYPVHLNPNVREPVAQILSEVDNVKLIEPVNYYQFLYLMNGCELIMTDSGGVQEEAPSLNKPVVILRDTTERPEIIKSGAGVLVGAMRDQIVTTTSKIIDSEVIYRKMSETESPFGSGHASRHITEIILTL